MAVSPNNCAFLLNLNFPLVNFVITMLHERPERDGMTLSFFNITLLNEQMIGEMAVYNALDAEIMLTNITAENKNQEEAIIYLKALKFALESQILNKLVDLE